MRKDLTKYIDVPSIKNLDTIILGSDSIRTNRKNNINKKVRIKYKDFFKSIIRDIEEDPIITDLESRVLTLESIEPVEPLPPVVVPSPIEYGVISDYRSSLEADGYIYSGYIINDTPVIVRCLDSVETTADNVTDLETDWTDRLTLTYN